VRLCVYDTPIPDMEGVTKVGDHSIDKGIHGYVVNYIARQKHKGEQFAYSDYNSGGFEACLEWCIENNIDVLNISKNMFKVKSRDEALQKALDKGIIIVAAAGNNSQEDVVWPAEDERVIAVGAYNPETNEIAGYSNYGKEIITVAKGEWSISTVSGTPYHGYGTSYASPVIAGYLTEWKRITGGTREEAVEFIKRNCKDIMLPGKDKYSGYGLFQWKGVDVLNRPEKIIIHHSFTEDTLLKDYNAIKRYHTEVKGWSDIGYHWVLENVAGRLHWIPGRDEKREGAHTIGMNDKSIGICVVGNFDKEVPSDEIYKEVAKKCKKLMQKYNLSVDDIEPHRKYAGYKTCPGKNFDIDKVKEYIQYKTIKTDVAPFIKDGRTFLPVRFFIEAFGGRVDWKSDTQEVICYLSGKKVTMQIGSKEIRIEEV